MSYWERRYRQGGTSGPGSAGAEAAHKAAILRRLLTRYEVGSLLDMGCGDGVVANLTRHRDYLGYDPSPMAVELARSACPGAHFITTLPEGPFDAVLSMDVIFHFPDDDDFARYLGQLFGLADRLVIVYGTDEDRRGASHVRHRHWTADIPPGWRVLEVHRGPFKTFWILGWQRPAGVEDIPGLIPITSGQLLERLARQVPLGQRVVEIGAYAGRSTGFLARGLRAGAGGRVLSIDPHGLPGAEMGRGGRFAGDRVRTSYLRHLGELDLLPFVEPVRALSAVAPLPEEPIGLLWIDGDHSAEAVAADVQRWVPLVASGGWVVIDDVGTHHPGVNAVVRRLQGEAGWISWDTSLAPLAVGQRA